MRGASSISELRRLGTLTAAQIALRQLFSTRRFLGLRCPLDHEPQVPTAKIPVSMLPRNAEFDGFLRELEEVQGGASLDAFVRQRMLASGIETLYVTQDENGAPVYGQWLVTHASLPTLDRFSPGRYPRLATDEALVEGAYTFARFRGLGVMAAGMAQLLVRARETGARAVFTYVGDDNVPSLRGCARVGFDLDHVRVNRRRFGRHTSRMSEVDDSARSAWRAAVGR